MPIYEYQCNCGHQFEKLRRLSDTSIQLCPKCGGETRKVLSVFQKGRSSSSSSSCGMDYSGDGIGCSACGNFGCAERH